MIEELRRLDEYDIHYLCRNTDPEYSPHGYSTYQYGTYLGKYGNIFDSVNLYHALKRIAPNIIYQTGLWGVTPGIHLSETFRRPLDLLFCSDQCIMPLPQMGLKPYIKFNPTVISSLGSLAHQPLEIIFNFESHLFRCNKIKTLSLEAY